MIRVYKLHDGILVEADGKFFQQVGTEWDTFINDDDVLAKTRSQLKEMQPVANPDELLATKIDAPMQNQELWASGVTYLRSKQGRQEESEKSGAADFYAHVYQAPRPELFFKANRNRVVAHRGQVRIRRDSSWDVPEPELVLVLTTSGKIIGYTIGNDMSSRSIEGENPLYLPQAKTYDGCAALGPCVLLTDQALSVDTMIRLQIRRNDQSVFIGSVAISQIKRRFTELAEYLFRECSFASGALLMTGTGIVPDSSFTLKPADEISIEISGIGCLENQVAEI